MTLFESQIYLNTRSKLDWVPYLEFSKAFFDAKASVEGYFLVRFICPRLWFTIHIILSYELPTP